MLIEFIRGLECEEIEGQLKNKKEVKENLEQYVN